MNKEKKHFSIGEVAKLRGMTIKALRYYHEIGLLSPNYIDEENGYRYYSIDQFWKMDIIKICRDFGVSIKELQELFARGDMAYGIEFIEKKQKEITEKIGQLHAQKSALTLISNKLINMHNVDNTNEWKVKYFPERYLLIVEVTELDEVGELEGLYQLEKKMSEIGNWQKYEYGTGYKISENGRLQPTFVFAEVDDRDFKAYQSEPLFRKVPSGYYLTKIFFGGREMIDVGEVVRKYKMGQEIVLSFDEYANIFHGEDEFYRVQIYVGENVGDCLK